MTVRREIERLRAALDASAHGAVCTVAACATCRPMAWAARQATEDLRARIAEAVAEHRRVVRELGALDNGDGNLEAFAVAELRARGAELPDGADELVPAASYAGVLP